MGNSTLAPEPATELRRVASSSPATVESSLSSNGASRVNLDAKSPGSAARVSRIPDGVLAGWIAILGTRTRRV